MQKTVRTRTAPIFGIAIALAIVLSMTTLSLTGCDNGTTSPGIILPPIGKTLVSINVTTQPTKTVYAIGESLSTAGMVVTAAYSDGSTAAVTGYTTSGFDSSSAGQKTVTVTYEGATTTFTVTVSGGTGNQTPTAEDFTVNGLSQIFDGNPKTVTITPHHGKSTGAITVYYNGAAAAPSAIGSYPVTFDVAAVEGWNAKTGLSAGTLIIAEQTANAQTPTAADFDIGNLAQIVGSVTAVTITPRQGKSDGAITIYYNGSTALPTAVGSYTVTFNIGAAVGWNAVTGLNAGTLVIAAQTLTGIAITTPPAKTTYNINEELDTTGMVVTATYNDGTTETVTGYTISGYDKTRTGNQTITVTYSGKTDTFTVNVILLSLGTVATPTALPSAGTYNTAQTVTLNTTTSGAAIYYTLDGTDPTTSSSLYSGAISIGATSTLKAFAVKDGMNNSGILTAIYTISSGSSSFIPPGTTVTTLTENVWADGNLPTSNDEQWFKFTATASTQYLHVSFGTVSFLMFQVYDSNGATVEIKSVNNGNFLYSEWTNKYLSMNVTVGQVYSIKVYTNSTVQGGTYNILYNTSSTLPIKLPSTAIQLTENIWADGNLPTSSDEQWFKFTATASTQFIHIYFGTSIYLEANVYDSNGSMVEVKKYFYSSKECNSWSVTVGQEYYIKTCPVGSYTGTYRIAFNATVAPPGVIQLTANTWADGNLPTENDVQRFKFTATASTQYIHVSFGTINFLRVYVYDSSGSMVEGEKHFYSSNKSNSWSVTVGREYYIKIWNSNTGGNYVLSGTYQISFNVSTNAPLPSNAATAIQLTENIWADGNLPTSSDEQWFKFTATASTQYIHASFGTLDNLYVQVYDLSGAAVESETELYNGRRYISRTVTVGLEYYIKVRPYASSYSGTYQISFNASTTAPSKTLTLPSSAIQLTANTWENGNISTVGGEQWFKFTATASTQYIHRTIDLYVQFQVCDSSGVTVGNESSEMRSTWNVTVGEEYYIRVRTINSSGTYQIAFSAIYYPPGITELTSSLTSGSISAQSSAWYRFTATTSTQTIYFKDVTPSSWNTLLVTVYDSSGNRVGAQHDGLNKGSSIQSLSRNVIVGQEYFIMIWSDNSDYGGSFKVSI